MRPSLKVLKRPPPPGDGNGPTLRGVEPQVEASTGANRRPKKSTRQRKPKPLAVIGKSIGETPISVYRFGRSFEIRFAFGRRVHLDSMEALLSPRRFESAVAEARGRVLDLGSRRQHVALAQAVIDAAVDGRFA